MVVSGLVKDLAWKESQWFTGGLPDNVCQTIFLVILLHVSHQEASTAL